MASIIGATSAGMLLACLGANACSSPIVLDHSPAAPAGNAHRNIAISQHFAEDVYWIGLYGTAGREAVIELAEPGSLPLAGVAGIALVAAQLARKRRGVRLP